MTSPHDEPAYEGLISGRISADIREPRSESVLRTRKFGWDIQSDPRGYPTDIVDKKLDLGKASYGPVRGPSLRRHPGRLLCNAPRLLGLFWRRLDTPRCCCVFLQKGFDR